tara:strand:- start:449 stop:715 length:267 start_codon:yes stop_codon:yes gene_type:complete
MGGIDRGYIPEENIDRLFNPEIILYNALVAPIKKLKRGFKKGLNSLITGEEIAFRIPTVTICVGWLLYREISKRVAEDRKRQFSRKYE